MCVCVWGWGPLVFVLRSGWGLQWLFSPALVATLTCPVGQRASKALRGHLMVLGIVWVSFLLLLHLTLSCEAQIFPTSGVAFFCVFRMCFSLCLCWFDSHCFIFLGILQLFWSFDGTSVFQCFWTYTSLWSVISREVGRKGDVGTWPN